MPHSSTDSALEDAVAEPTAAETQIVKDEDPDVLTDKQWKLMFREALQASSEYQQTKLRSPWSRNYRAYNNRHMQGSKYEAYRYRHRSKLFKPKTRMAVRKNDATAASAMFSTEDVVSITPERPSDRLQSMTATFIHEALNYRLDRDGPFTGPSWFLTAIGARQDSQLTGVCISKQYWEYEERDVEVLVTRPMIDVNGMPMIDPETGEAMTEDDIEVETEAVIDRPMMELMPPEQCFIDPTGDWRDPIQRGGYFFAGFPVRKEDLEEMIAQQAARPKMGGGAWRTDIDVGKLDQGKGNEQRETQAVRRSREDGVDRYESRMSDRNSDVLWLFECFYRYGGHDWHFWMLGEHIMLSDPRPVEESYPEQKGMRPYVRGLGALESHKVVPMAPVETWQPLQQEMNDITNLRLDSMKMSISPITKIRRGRNIDFKQVQNRGPDAMVMVEDEDDVVFDRAPVPPNTQQDLNNLNVDFDELAGVFSQSSVQTNRQMNETVGGLGLIASSANSVTEFDLRVWVETWAEPVLRQCVNLIQYYESSETVIAVAGEKAGLLSNIAQDRSQDQSLDAPDEEEMEEPPIPAQMVLDNLEQIPISVRVNVGIGAMDSRQKLEKFMGGVKMTMEMLPVLASEGIVPNAKEMMQEGWGLLGYKDAARFYKAKPQQEEGPPETVQLEMLKQKGAMARDQQKSQAQKDLETMRLMVKRMESTMKNDLGQQAQDLDEREFAHQSRMDEIELGMRGFEQQLNGISDAINRMAEKQQKPDGR